MLILYSGKKNEELCIPVPSIINIVSKHYDCSSVHVAFRDNRAELNFFFLQKKIVKRDFLTFLKKKIIKKKFIVDYKFLENEINKFLTSNFCNIQLKLIDNTFHIIKLDEKTVLKNKINNF